MPRASLPLTALALLGLLVPAGRAADPADKYPGLNLIPWPKTVRLGEGRMELTAKSRIVLSDDSLKPLAKVLAGEIALLTKLRLDVAAGAARRGDIVLEIDSSLRTGQPMLAVRGRKLVRTREGAHTLTVGETAVVAGFDYRAVAEGTATLLQALGQSTGRVSLPKLTIEDWPHADFCGQMVDVGRQNHPVEWLEKMVEVCRFYKVRYLQLHLTDDQGWTFPSTKYPKLGSKNYGAHGGVAPKVYTLAELEGLVAFADARGVTLVPEMEVPGHSGAALRSMPEVFDAIDPRTKRPVGLGCMNMANEEIYPALDAVIGEMCAVFRSSPYFHIGSDEVSMGRVSLHPGYKAFMSKHRLKDDHALADYFIARVNEMVKKHGKKAIKWEGLANEASKDIIIMAWDKNNDTARKMIAKGYTTITCPWDLGVPWEEWNMYICNGSKLKKGEPVLGATLVAWEQPPATHLAGVRNVASRQERTWGPDNAVTAQGFASRYQPLDAAVGVLVGMPVKPRRAATFSASVGTRDLSGPAFAFDGNDATFYRQDAPLAVGGHFTVRLDEPTSVYSLEVRTGINGKGLLEGGEVQVSADGKTFETVTTLAKGVARTVLTKNGVRSIRLVAKSAQKNALVVREIELRLMVGSSGVVKDPAKVVGVGNVASLKGDTTFALPSADCDVPAIVGGHTLTLDAGGNPCTYSGPITGTGKVEVRTGRSLTLGGKSANTMRGSWAVKAGRLVLSKPAGVRAIGGTIVVGGPDGAGIVWNAADQVEDIASVRLLASARGGASLNLNGFRETIGRLTLDAGAEVLTDGPSGAGVLTVAELVVGGKTLPKGVYAASTGWVRGGGYVLAGGAKGVPVSGRVADPDGSVGAENVAVLTAAGRLELSGRGAATSIDTRTFPLTLAASGAARYSGFIAGNGSVRIEASPRPLEMAGPSSNSYRGPTTLARGVLKLSKSGGAIAVPGDLTLGGSAPENDGDGVIWGADGQLARSSVVTLTGNRPSFLDLAGHKAAVARVDLSRAAMIRTGEGGSLAVKQLHVDGKRLQDGTYTTPQTWLKGTGKVVVDSRVAVAGRQGDIARMGAGNTADLTGDTFFGYPISDCDLDIHTNGHTVTFDSGDGNAFTCRGAISGKGNVVFLMGPSHTGFRDAPMRLGGTRPNTTTGKFFVRKGRVQLEKPDGVDAISGDVVVGGQGFNDCLFWTHDNQIKDSASITLIDAGGSGAAYLHLNGCRETVAGLMMKAVNTVKTDAAGGAAGVLTVRTLTIGGVKQPAGVYTTATARWIEGKGKVVVRP